MQAFEFSLERALRWRSAQYEMESARLAALERERSSIEKLTATLIESRRRASLAVAERGSVTGAELARVAQYRESAGSHLLLLDQRLRDCLRRIAQQRKRVVAADRAKRLLEEIRQRDYKAWNYELQREIENTAGELYLARWSRRNQP